jgi:hypothetical protein
MLPVTTLGCIFLCQRWVEQPNVDAIKIANYFIATLGALTQCCPHQRWVVMNCHVLRATLGVLTHDAPINIGL